METQASNTPRGTALKKQREKEAHEIVESLIENPVSKDFFFSSLVRLTRQHYEDITVERSLSNLCGYCLCVNKLPPVPRQTHRIVQNRIYDITVRKRFCSNSCFTISCQVSEQIPLTPLWLRDYDSSSDSLILATPVTRQVGEEVVFVPPIVNAEEIGGLQLLDGGVIEKSNAEDFDYPSANCTPPTSSTAKSVETFAKAGEQCNELDGTYTQLDQSFPTSLLRKVEETLNEWITPDTAKLVLHRESFVTTSQSLKVEPTSQMQSNFSTQEATVTNLIAKTKLINDTTEFEERVNDFYRRSSAPSPPGVLRHQQLSQGSIPHANSSEIRHVREGLILNKIMILVRDLSPPLPDIGSDLRAFVKSLNLTKNNVTAQAELWPMLTVSILFVLSCNNVLLEEVMNSVNFGDVLQKILAAYGSDSSNLKEMVLKLIQKSSN